MHFRITHHSGFAAPADALDLLWQRLGSERDEVAFSKVGPELMARTEEDAPVSMTRDERADIGRRMVWDIVREVSEQAPELRSDWFAVSSER